MDFDPNEEQLMLRDSLRRYLADHRRSDPRPQRGRDARDGPSNLWRGLAQDLGILGAALDVERGGLGGGPVELMIIQEELGRALAREPFLETIVIGAHLLALCPAKGVAEILNSVLNGERLLAYAWAEHGMEGDLSRVTAMAVRDGGGWRLSGVKQAVLAASQASYLLVLARTLEADAESQGLAIFLVEKHAPGVACTEFETLDGRSASDVRFERVFIPREMRLTTGDASRLAREIADRAIAAGCAEAVGLMSALLDDTAAHIKQRRQFGVPLSTFQVLRHRIADMVIQLELATSGMYLATLSLGDKERRCVAVTSAKFVVDEAARFIGQNAIQLHGGMGMSDELAVGHYVKRLMVIAADFGGADMHASAYA